jgi:hypothetical protein
MKTIEIIVAPDGKTTVQTKGFAGSACRDATRLLEAALGEVSEERLTAEFHQSQASQQQRTASR